MTDKDPDVLEYGNKASRIVLVQPVEGHHSETVEKEIALIREHFTEDFRLVAFKVQDWNHDLSPWKVPAVFGKEDFGGCAKDTLSEVMKLCSDRTKIYYIGGYSLAGLFALWTAYQTDLFRGIAAASPSVWFPGFLDYMKEHRILSGHVYLSLGNREERTRNPVMATVGEKIRAAHELFTEQGADCTLEWNEGNHFRDADLRTAKAFLWVLQRQL